MSLPIQRGPITINDLDIKLMSDWYGRFDRSKDRAERFVFGWIVLNHVYSRYWEQIHPAGEEGGDKRQLMALAESQPITAVFADSAKSWQSRRSITLPLVNRYGRNVPSTGRAGVVTPQDLTVVEFFEIVYEVRNSLIHGKRGTRGFEDQIVIAFADGFGEFLKLLVRRLNTAP